MVPSLHVSFSGRANQVVVFEGQTQIGDTWVYDERIEPDPLSLDPARPIIHTSLYSSHRTNLPRKVMGFRDYRFISLTSKTRDPRWYPVHGEVLLYLQDFAREFELEDMMRFETEVVHVGLVEDFKKWKVRSKKKRGDNDGGDIIFDLDDEIYDAVVVCNGHFTEPRVAEIPGIGSWPGKLIHSHNYRVPEPFQDQVVILIGSSSSATDISREIAGVAKEVHIASRSVEAGTYEEQPGYDNIWLHSMIQNVHKDGSVIFRNGRVVLADIILHCTGCPFPKSKWIAGVLSGGILLPSQGEMMEDVEAFYRSLDASNIPKRYTHNMADSQISLIFHFHLLMSISLSTTTGLLLNVGAKGSKNGESKCTA